MQFGIVENEAEERMEQLRALDKAYADGESYPECPRCNGSRTVEAITKMNGDYFPVTTEHFSCPLCGGTGEAEAERAQDWLIEILEEHELSDDDEKYIDEREKIA